MRQATELAAFIGKRIKVRCGRCRRVFEVVGVDPGGYQRESGQPLRLESVLDGSPDGRGTYARPSLLTENANRRDRQGRRVDWDAPGRFTYTCHRRCVSNGRRTRYTVTAALLEERFVRAARAGLDEIVLGGDQKAGSVRSHGDDERTSGRAFP